MEIKLKAINKKYQSKINKAIDWLIKYSNYNDARDLAYDNDDLKNMKFYDTKCINAFDKYLTIFDELPMREKVNIEKSKYY